MIQLLVLYRGGMMDDRLKRNFVEQMREELKKQLSEFELAKETEERKAKVVSNEGPKKWLKLKDCLKDGILTINDGFSEGLLSYRENATGTELTLTHELNRRDTLIAFDPASAVISYTGKGKGEFRPWVQ